MRTKSFPAREVLPDPKYGSLTVAKLIHRMMKSGKKTIAQKLVYQTFDLIKNQTKKDPKDVFEEALAKIQPQVEVRSRRVGGASYQIPAPVSPRRASSLAIRWLVIEADKRPNKDYHTFAQKLAAEIIDALKEQGGAVNRKNTSHRMAEANKAFAHFRW